MPGEKSSVNAETLYSMNYIKERTMDTGHWNKTGKKNMVLVAGKSFDIDAIDARR